MKCMDKLLWYILKIVILRAIAATTIQTGFEEIELRAHMTLLSNTMVTGVQLCITVYGACTPLHRLVA